jgi:hypothetical protein
MFHVEHHHTGDHEGQCSGEFPMNLEYKTRLELARKTLEGLSFLEMLSANPVLANYSTFPPSAMAK